MRRRSLRTLLRHASLALLASLPFAADAAPLPGGPAAAPSPGRAVVDAAVRAAFAPRPAVRSKVRGAPAPARPTPYLRQAPDSVPVVVQYSRPVADSDVRSLAALGVTGIERFSVAPGARARLRSRALLADLPAKALSAAAALDGVARISLDGQLFPAPRPLDFTAAEVQASDVWRSLGADGLPIDGHGITICDIDSGVDPFHPLLFRPDGNGGKPYMAWVDSDGDGIFHPGADGVDLRGDGVIVRLQTLNSVTTEIFDDSPLFGTDDPALDVGFDFLYADVNGSGARERGLEAGFTEQDPTYGEPLFAVDDVDGDGVLDVGEKIVALGSSKLRAVRTGKKVYRRGENLIEAPVTEDVYHGTGASGVLVAGERGLTRLVGMAPGADLVMAANTDGTSELKLAKFCHDEGARVVLHEYAPWVGYDLDGSSPMEQYIDETMAEDTVHVNPAGNLSGSEKLYKHPLTPGATTDVPVVVPEGWGFAFMGMSLIWRDTSRPLVITVEDPQGFTKDLSGSALGKPWQPGQVYWTARTDSDRGTARVDFYLFSDGADPAPIVPGTWKLHVTDAAPPDSAPITLVAYVMDEISGWGKGIYFPEHTTEEHFIGYPGTADHGIPIAAYTGHGFWGGEPGERAYYSGRGLRIDGAPILWLSAPDDPITSGYHEGWQSAHVIYGGTSGASPHVAGTAALMLAHDPTLTGDAVKEALRAGALADPQVLAAGAVPNTDYGYGKLRIHESIFGAPPPGGAAPSIKIAPVTVEEGEEAEVTIAVSDPDEPATALKLELDADYDGVFEAALDAPSLTAPASEIGTLVSKVRVTDSTGRSASALAFVNVVEKGTLPEPETPDLDIEVAGGGACAVSPSAPPPASRDLRAPLLAGLLGLAAVARRRRRRSV